MEARIENIKILSFQPTTKCAASVGRWNEAIYLKIKLRITSFFGSE